jgi:hypothetical protein
MVSPRYFQPFDSILRSRNSVAFALQNLSVDAPVFMVVVNIQDGAGVGPKRIKSTLRSGVV